MLISWLQRRKARWTGTTQAKRHQFQKPRSRLLLEALEDRTLLTTANEVFVAVLYRDMLRRDPDPVGLSFWASQLATGTSALQVAKGIETSLEHRTLEVQDVYRFVLGRAGDPQGMTFWVGFMQSGGTVGQMVVGFFTSVEFVSQKGSTPQVFLDNIYLVLLNRHVDPVGAAYWGGLLASGTSNSAVVQAIGNSPEAVGIFVEGFYERDLHRKGDPQGLKYWSNNMLGGEDSEDIQENFFALETVQRINVYIVQITNVSSQTAVQVAQTYLVSITVV